MSRPASLPRKCRLRTSWDAGLGLQPRIVLGLGEHHQQVLPTNKNSQMIVFTFANGGVATMWTTGTEPKIKYYAELCPPHNRREGHSWWKLAQEAAELLCTSGIHGAGWSPSAWLEVRLHVSVGRKNLSPAHHAFQSLIPAGLHFKSTHYEGDPEQLKKELMELVNAIEENFFQPQKYHLQAKSE